MTDLNLPGDASPIERADARVAEALVPYAGEALVGALGEVSDFTDQEPLYAAAAAVIGTGALMRNLRVLRFGTRMLASHLLATALRGMIKRAVDRTRPHVAAEEGKAYELRSGRRYESDFNSFPSGHSAGAFSVARALGRDYPAAAWPALAAASAASAAQVVRSRHFPTDVVAGIAVGLLAEAAVARLIEAAEEV